MKTITHPASKWLLATRDYALLYVLILTISTSVFGSEPNQQWVARYNGPGNDNDSANALKIDNSGNVYVAGSSIGFGTSYDYATIKYSPDGNQLWAARYNGDDNDQDYASAMAIDNSGNVYVTGESQGFDYDYATIKYGPGGNQLWVARYNGPAGGADNACGLAVDNSGNVYVAGSSPGNGTGSDYATIKYNSNGSQLWVKRYNGDANSHDYAIAMAIDNSGNVYVTGYSIGSGTGYDYTTVKYSTDGNQLWVKRYNEPGNSGDYSHALVVDGSRNVYVTGWSDGSGSDVDYATIKYNPDGNQLWVARYNGPGNSIDAAEALAVDNSGNVYVTGESVGSSNYTDYSTIKYSPDGNQLWVARYNGPGNFGDVSSSLAVDNSGNVYVTGWSTGSGTGNDYATVKYSPDGNQLWVTRYTGPGDNNDMAYVVAVDNSGNVYVTGWSYGSGTSSDYATFKYAQQQSNCIYVDASATGANNGSSWANAYKYLQNALWAAGSGTEIWVAQGTYRPDRDTNHPSGTGDRYATFQLKNGVATYGGFPTGGGSWATRCPNIQKTILSGDIGVPHSYHVVTGESTNSTAILDGFTITAGNADGEDIFCYGGGMWNDTGNPTVNNCTFSGNSALIGGGMCNNGSPTVTNCTFSGNSAADGGCGGGMWNGSGSPTVNNCTFSGNSALTGGGMFNEGSSPTLTNCTFSGNSADSGGGMWNGSGSPTVINCTFSGNSASGYGGGMVNSFFSNSIVTNCTFSGNSATHGGGMYNYEDDPTLTNCILWGNSNEQIYNDSSVAYVSYSDIQDGWSGTGNINSNPLFVDANGPDNIFGTADDNLRLKSGSPCIDAAKNSAVPVGIVTDIDGRSRFFNDTATADTGNGTPPIVDMGAYEYHPIIFVDANAAGGNNGSTFADAYKYLQDALDAVEPNYEIWVAQGTYRPDEDSDDPDGNDSRTATFQLKNNVAIYGGFPSGGGLWLWDTRNPNVNKAILSGDIGIDGNNNDNSYHVVTGSGTNSTAVLDGFTVTAGKANGSYPYNAGGGVYDYNGSPTLTNCTLSGNSATGNGGGMFSYYSYSSSQTLTNCTFSGNVAANYGGGMYNAVGSPTLINCTFSSNSSSIDGGGMFNVSNSPVLTGCTFTGNSAFMTSGGGMFNSGSSPTLTNCAFSSNWSYYGGGMHNYSSNPTVINCTFTGNSGEYYGGGMYSYHNSSPILTDCNFISNFVVDPFGEGGGMWVSGCVINVKAGGSVYTTDEFYFGLTSRVQGTGSIVVGLGGEMIVLGDAVVDLNDPNDPNLKGTIQCDGLLKVKGNGQLKHARVNISRQAGGFFGKFQVEGSAQVRDVNIYADGDRFMEVDPCTFTGIIRDNRIYVTVTEGQNGSDEGVLELRGLDIDELHCDPCDPNVLVCQIDGNAMPPFDTNTWTLERLEVAAGAKVTLMDRFSSDNGEPEVLYVKNIVLGAGCVLNVGLERLYYTNLSGDPNLIKVDALLGVSLDKIDCDSNEEFEKRVSNDNFTSPTDPNYNKIYIERVVGLEPDPNGMMKMSNLEDPCSGQIISARAKAAFASAAEEKLWVQFNYLFNTSDPCAQIVVYLSDVPEMLDSNDPCRDAHYIEVGRISAPPWPRPGSAGSGRFGNFEEEVMAGELDLKNGTWVELELNEPGSGQFLALDNYKKTKPGTLAEGGCATAFVDDADVKLYCCWGYCLDLNWDLAVTDADYLKVVRDVGKSDANTPCRDGAFSRDGYVDTYDTASWDWTLNLNARKNVCMLVPVGGLGFTAVGGFGNFGGPRALINPSDFNDLLITGKREIPNDPNKLKDRLYVFDSFDSNAVYLRWLGLNSPSDRCNIKVVRGEGNDLYRINSQEGISRLDGNNTCIVPKWHTTYTSEPRYGRPATVYVGVQGTDSNPSGRPIIDAAFDANFVYVVPVVVAPDGNASYAAAARLKLNQDPDHPYDVNKLYDGPLLPNDNQRKYRNALRDIELDSAGNVYVTNAHVKNECDILWKFEPNGTVVRRLNLGNPNEANYLPAPTGMCVSSTTNVLYLASSSLYTKADPNSTVIYGFSTEDFNLVRTITVSKMQHITSITEDPTTKSLWVAGFDMNSTALPSRPFYDPYIANVPQGVNNVSAKRIVDANDISMPLSIVWTGARPAQKKCGGADLNGSGNVNLLDFAKFAQYWLCAPSDCDGADLEPEQSPDGDVDIRDLDVFADHWLNTNCQ